MNDVEKVKQICKERKIPISKLEKDLGFANGYVGQLKKGYFPSDRAKKISTYLGIELTGTDGDGSLYNLEDIAKDETERRLLMLCRNASKSFYLLTRNPVMADLWVGHNSVLYQIL